MTPENAIHVIREALMAAFWLSAPLLVIGFGVGVIMNLIQVATSLQDSAFSTFPRLAAFLGGFILLMPWMLNKLTTYTAAVFTDIARYGH
jgi:flagellar biosynthetic protein FliQ